MPVLVFWPGSETEGHAVRSMPVIAIVAALAGSACALDGAKPATPAVPAAFEQPSTQGPWPDADWYRGFASGELDSLIALAGDNSLDIAAAAARVKQADARARQAGAALLPQVDPNGNATQFGGGSHGATAHETDWAALLSASYEIDFWGKNRAAANSAQALAGASRADLAAVRITISNSVAASYFQVLSLRERIALARAESRGRPGNPALHRGPLSMPAASARRNSPRSAPRSPNAELIVPQLQQQEAEARGSAGAARRPCAGRIHCRGRKPRCAHRAARSPPACPRSCCSGGRI